MTIKDNKEAMIAARRLLSAEAQSDRFNDLPDDFMDEWEDLIRGSVGHRYPSCERADCYTIADYYTGPNVRESKCPEHTSDANTDEIPKQGLEDVRDAQKEIAQRLVDRGLF